MSSDDRSPALWDKNDSYLSRIRTQSAIFTRAQKRIANYFSDHPEEIISSTITTLAEKIGTTPPSITRFCQAIHYKGFSDLKFCIERNLSTPFTKSPDVEPSDDVSEIKKKLLQTDVKAITDSLRLLDDQCVKRAAQAICQANMVHIYADGGPGATANFAYQLFLQIGIPCNFFTDIRLALLAVTQLKPRDIAVGITFSGNAGTVIDAIHAAKMRKAYTIGITANRNSILAKSVAIPLCYSLSIEDDLRYLHVARMCETAIIGLLQSAVINQMPQRLRDNIAFSKNAIQKSRVR
ncbi:MurR/RpiR family transcriptional regulator [Marasmitruncus massiliensis]|uniref:MurR/RpiR family transcriptional regulator n=1 Tax=Marasmitruncus massiliensis TaxID=1944642 RepID=UPI000C7BB9CA|nr:MurR/RpiR family transcriptional regulator [Marasmitruncus massiliensis]